MHSSDIWKICSSPSSEEGWQDLVELYEQPPQTSLTNDFVKSRVGEYGRVGEEVSNTFWNFQESSLTFSPASLLELHKCNLD